MSNYRFNLRLTKEAKKAVDNVDRGDKNQFINDAIEAKEKNEFESELLTEIKSISSSLRAIAECMKNTDFSRVQTIPTENKKEKTKEEKDKESIQDKLSEFVIKYAEM